MLSAEQVKKDLNRICAQTNARWLCYDDIHTVDFQKDANVFALEMARLGYSKKLLMLVGGFEPSYGGGVEIKHQQEAVGSGYTLNGYGKNNNRLVVLYGFETDNDKHTVYHEGAHLLQFKYNIFSARYRDDYKTYLMETHANTFAAMVLFLRADNVLEYKKCRLGRLASGIYNLNDKREEMLYYVSLPMELALMKEMKKKGREKFVQEFSKKGKLDFKKIAFYTKKLVEKYAYSKQEFETIKKGNVVLRHEILKRKAKAYRILGKAYWKYETLKYRQKQKKHYQVEKERLALRLEKVKRLPDQDAEAEVINAVCGLDNYNVKMICEFDIASSLQKLKEETEASSISDSLKNRPNKIEDMMMTFEKMKEIYQKYKDNPFFQQLFSKIQSFDERDEVWKLKEQKRQEITRRKFIFGTENIR